MNIELSEDELTLIDILLSKEEEETKIEIHHCKNHVYKDYLKDRERQVSALLGKIKDALATIE